MQRIYFSVNTLEVSAHKLRAYGLKEECLQNNVYVAWKNEYVITAA